MTKPVLSDIKRHHVEQDNARLREALRTIVIVTADNETDAATLQALRDIARIARAALISAAPENTALRPVFDMLCVQPKGTT